MFVGEMIVDYSRYKGQPQDIVAMHIFWIISQMIFKHSRLKLKKNV